MELEFPNEGVKPQKKRGGGVRFGLNALHFALVQFRSETLKSIMVSKCKIYINL